MATSVLAILAGISVVATILFGFLRIVEGLRDNWSFKKQLSIAALCLVVVIGICLWLAKGKVIVGERDLLSLREIAERAYDRQDYHAAAELLTWAIQFKSDDEFFYRMRARAFHRLGPDHYPAEIEDRKIVLKLNPYRDSN